VGEGDGRGGSGNQGYYRCNKVGCACAVRAPPAGMSEENSIGRIRCVQWILDYLVSRFKGCPVVLDLPSIYIQCLLWPSPTK
jgi:hypothetical protein